MSLTKKILFPILSVFLSILFLFLVAEPICRYYDPSLRLVEGRKNPFWQKHPTRGHSLKPGYIGTSIWGVEFRVNRLGFRGKDIQREKPKNFFRILCLGDSITMGSALGEDFLYTSSLEVLLKKAHPRLNFEVINAGVSGYGIREELLVYEEEGKALKPDIVIVQFCLNDVLGLEFADLINPTKDVDFPLKNFILKHSAFARFIRERYQRVGLTNNFFGLSRFIEPAQGGKEEKRLKKGWEEYEAYLNELKALVDKEGAELVVLVVPHRAQFEDYRKRFIPQNKLKEIGNNLKITVIDIGKSSGVNPDKFYVAPDPVHPSAFGHSLIAQEIYNWLNQGSENFKFFISNGLSPVF